MIKKNKGKIVFMLSSVTFDRPSAYMSPYVSLKYLLLGLVKSLSSEYKGANINFNSISPSMMDTPFLKNLDKKFIEINKQLNPSKKLLNINKVVKKIEFLISPNSNKIKGVNFLIKN
jgi:3-oxoacyl-[acyl-carrier protein] reductase